MAEAQLVSKNLPAVIIHINSIPDQPTRIRSPVHIKLGPFYPFLRRLSGKKSIKPRDLGKILCSDARNENSTLTEYSPGSDCIERLNEWSFNQGTTADQGQVNTHLLNEKIQEMGFPFSKERAVFFLCSSLPGYERNRDSLPRCMQAGLMVMYIY
ncbi:hypothetical protein ABKN59_003183 [Abortiporus biennis]